MVGVAWCLTMADICFVSFVRFFVRHSVGVGSGPFTSSFSKGCFSFLIFGDISVVSFLSDFVWHINISIASNFYFDGRLLFGLVDAHESIRYSSLLGESLSPFPCILLFCLGTWLQNTRRSS